MSIPGNKAESATNTEETTPSVTETEKKFQMQNDIEIDVLTSRGTE